MIAYNEECLIGGALRSLQGRVDEIVVVDGRIDEFPGDTAISTDATETIAREYGATVIQQKTPYPTEQIMRSKYLVGEENDWYFVLDADEILMSDIPNLKLLTESAYRIPEHFLGASHMIYPIRFFKHIGTMEYLHIHDAVFRNGELLKDAPTLNSMWILHRQGQRTPDRMKLKTVKRKICHDRERPLRKQLGMESSLWQNEK
jgi:glycosyltransferase involved in cell wall biosynthesis